MFYQLVHPGSSDYFLIEKGTNFSFPHHMHQCFEFIVSLEGEMTVLIDETEYIIKKGEAVLIFPNQIHALSSCDSKHMLCIFSPKLVSAFHSKNISRLPLDNKFFPPAHLITAFQELCEDITYLSKKGYLYLMCDAFETHAKYYDSHKDNKNLLAEIFKFIENNYKEDCTLKELSASIGYDYAYLSRYFKNVVGISFNSYVNMYRLNHACYLLDNTSDHILNIAIESGYKSLRSFNRNFKIHFGISPNEYVKASIQGRKS